VTISTAAQILSFRYGRSLIFSAYTVLLLCPPEEKIKDRQTRATLTAGLPDDFSFFELFEPAADVVHIRWFPSEFIPELTLNTH
jgi:hypothetical protein